MSETTTKGWRADYQVHPAAKLLPTLSDAALEELADDIVEHGLQEPLAVWIDNTAVSDAGVRHLKALTQLKVLPIYNTRITDAGTSEILNALPGVSFHP